MSRVGKIARLPREIREELNQRLADGEPGSTLLAWLEGLPAVKTVLEQQFDGAALTPQNLSEWRRGGYLEWQGRRELLARTRELAADARELRAATDGELTDHLATLLAARYAAVLASWDGSQDEESQNRLRLLGKVCQDIAALRRSDQESGHLLLERERFARERERTTEELFLRFKEWAKEPALEQCLRENDWLHAEKMSGIREILGLEELPEPDWDDLPEPGSADAPSEDAKSEDGEVPDPEEEAGEVEDGE